MVCSLGQAADAAYYIECQQSYRPAGDYYVGGEEPDGVWFNPTGLFEIADGGKVETADWMALYRGFSPVDGSRLTQNAGKEGRSAGLDMTFSADKTVSALWAVADPELRAEIERAHNDAARTALEEIVVAYCSHTRIRTREGEIRVVDADLIAAMLQHGSSRANDPQLHTHCVILNVARAHFDGKFRAVHQYPLYRWKMAAGAAYRNALAWNLRERLGIRTERYGARGEFTRVVGIPEDLVEEWSKRRRTIEREAAKNGYSVKGNASRAARANLSSRARKEYHDNGSEERHERWRSEAEAFVENVREMAKNAVGHEIETTREAIRKLTETLEKLPADLTREEAVFRLPDLVERVQNATAGLLDRDAISTCLERALRNDEIVRMDEPEDSADAQVGLAHTRTFSTKAHVGMEEEIREMAGEAVRDDGFALPAQEIEAKIERLLKDGYPLSEEQTEAIRYAAGRAGRVTIVEGAAGSGKTTTLRPVADLYRDRGYRLLGAAVAWRTAVALGNDCEIPPYSVARLLRMAAKGQLEIDDRTVIFVDEAGMLSVRQAYSLMRLSKLTGAKILWAGDTEQQQPVEAGPGLRLVRDVAGSARVDRIRRQLPDIDDVLRHVDGLDAETARLKAGMMPAEERESRLRAFAEMADKPEFTPWQAAASEALKDCRAEEAIAAWDARGRFHLAADRESALTALVDDWDRYRRENPDRSTMVLARTHAEVGALSFLMRERVLAGREDAERAVVRVARGKLDDRRATPLEIARGDRLRCGAPHWGERLFNGTIVTVDDFRVEKLAGGRKTSGGDDFRLWIEARTEDGRKVAFAHDEVADYWGNIRLDYGYALTITSAQGATVDHAFLLADEKPARETIYPAATRHREGLDVYVDREPPAMDIAARRPEDRADEPVTDRDVKEYLARRWSREQPKVAAVDHMSDELRARMRAEREAARASGRKRGRDGASGETGKNSGSAENSGAARDSGRTGPGGDGADAGRAADPERRSAAGGAQENARTANDDTVGARTRAAAGRDGGAANDNWSARMARAVRNAALDLRYGEEMRAFARERGEIMEAWGYLRARARREGAAVAAEPAFAATLARHAAALETAARWRAKPRRYAPVLDRVAGIGKDDLDEFETQYLRADGYRKAAAPGHERNGRSTFRDAEEEMALAPERSATRPSAADLSAALAARAEEVCRIWLPNGRRAGNYWQAGSVAGERGQSLYVHLAGDRRGKWTDAATGEKGDLLDLIRAASGHARMIDAMDEARAFLGGDPPSAREERSRPRTDARRLRQFLRSGRGIGTETPAARYLRRRGLSPADAGDLRFHPGAWVQAGGETRAMPALLAPVRTPDGTLEAVHRIFLAPDGRPADIEGRKRNMGMPGGGAVWFGDPRTAKRVALCEGIEDALAVLRVLTPEERRGLAVAATLSAGRIAAVEIPAQVREAVLVQDRDAAGERAWEALQARFAGTEVRVSRALPKGKDANDDLLELGPEALRTALGPLTGASGGPREARRAETGGPRRTFTEAERKAAFAALRMELDAVGAGAVGLKLAEALEKGVEGRYARGVIEVALAEPGTMRSVLRHEIVHALRDLGALSDGDWEVLAARARDEWLDAFDIRTRYADRPEEAQIEEAVAEAWRRWSENRLEIDPQVSWLFARIARLLEKIREAFRSRGALTAEDVFRAIDRGERPVDPERAAEGRRLQERLERLNADWKERAARADAGGVHVMYLDGHAEFVERMKAVRAELDDDAGRQIDRALEYLAAGRAARRRIDEYVAAVDRNDARRTELFTEWERSAAASIRDVPSYAAWRAESERLLADGRAILADSETCGLHLAGDDLVSWTVGEIEEAHERDDAIREPLWPDDPGASRLEAPCAEPGVANVTDPADLARGDVLRWTETVEAGPWPASSGQRTIEAVVEDIVADAGDAGKDGIGLVVRQAGGVRPPETGERIFRSADALAHCRRAARPDEEARRTALQEKEAERAKAAGERRGLSRT